MGLCARTGDDDHSSMSRKNRRRDEGDVLGSCRCACETIVKCIERDVSIGRQSTPVARPDRSPEVGRQQRRGDREHGSVWLDDRARARVRVAMPRSVRELQEQLQVDCSRHWP